MAATLALFTVPFIFAFGGLLDVLLLSLFTLVRNRDAIPINTTVIIGIVKFGVAIFAFLQTLRYFLGLNEKSSPTDGFPAKPMIFPCRTSHTRLFPKTHSFSYSYLWVGVPVGWKGSVGGMLSSDDPRKTYPWCMRFSIPGGSWYTVNGDDYLGRGHVEGGLEEKLQNYFKSKVRQLFAQIERC